MNANARAGVLGVGVIGCGRAAVDLHLPVLSRLPGLRVTALCDSDTARLTQVGRAWGVASLYRDHGDLLGDPAVQVVLIAVPTPEHHDVFLRATEAGKHIYVEKPLALDLAQADRMLAAAASSRGRTVLGFNLRSHRLVRSAHACIRSGALGRVVALRTVLVGSLPERVLWQRRRAQGGGAIYELGSHHFDLWRFLLDSEAAEVRAHSLSNGSDDSTVAVSARLSSGALASSILALSGAATHQVEVIGQAATLRFSLYRADSFHIEPVGRLSELINWLARLPGAVRAARRGGDYLDSYRAHWMRFLEAPISGHPPAAGERRLGLLGISGDSGGARDLHRARQRRWCAACPGAAGRPRRGPLLPGALLGGRPHRRSRGAVGRRRSRRSQRQSVHGGELVRFRGGVWSVDGSRHGRAGPFSPRPQQLLQEGRPARLRRPARRDDGGGNRASLRPRAPRLQAPPRACRPRRSHELRLGVVVAARDVPSRPPLRRLARPRVGRGPAPALWRGGPADPPGPPAPLPARADQAGASETPDPAVAPHAGPWAGLRRNHRHPLTLASLWRQHFQFGRGAARFHEACAARHSGRMRDHVGFHLQLPRWWRRAIATEPHRGRPARALPPLGLWQLANACGYVCERLRL